MKGADGFIFCYGVFISHFGWLFFLDESAMIHIWIRHQKIWIRHKLNESPPIFRRGFILCCVGFVLTSDGFILWDGGFIFYFGWLSILNESAMTYLWIRHPSKWIRHIFSDEFKHFCAGFVKTNGGFICFYGGFIFSLGWFVLLHESAMTYLWIRHNNKWIRHQIYESFTMYHESASIIRRGFIIKGPWLLEIVCWFIFLWTESALCGPVVSCVVLLSGVLSCVVLC